MQKLTAQHWYRVPLVEQLYTCTILVKLVATPHISRLVSNTNGTVKLLVSSLSLILLHSQQEKLLVYGNKELQVLVDLS